MQTAKTPDQAPVAGATRQGVTLPLLVAVVVMLTFLTIPPAPVDLKVDADTSLSAVLNYAQQHGLQHGTDLVYTYGPLGYLIFFYFSPNAPVTRMVVDVVFCLTVAAGLCLVAWRLRLAWRCLLLGAFVFASANLRIRTDLAIYTGFLCWGLLCWVESGPRLVIAAVIFTGLAVFSALAKSSLIFMAGVSIVCLAGGLAARGLRRVGLGMIFGFGAGVPLAWMAAGQNLWHLGPWLAKTLALVKGYNEALGWEGLPGIMLWASPLTLGGVAMVMIRAVGAFEGSEPGAPWRRVWLLAWLCWLLLLIWKHGVVREDSWHVVYLFGFLSVLAPALEVLPCGSGAARLWARVLAVPCCVLSLVALQNWFFARPSESLKQPYRVLVTNAGRLLNPADYWRSMNEAIETNRRECRLPLFREKVGNASVDVFGQHQVYALMNDFNYQPRPVIQSYAACSARLMKLNEQHYLSSAAPAYVMFDLGPIDRRFPPLEDAMVLRDLLLNYGPVAEEGGFLLLEHKSSRAAQLTLLKEGVVLPGERIELTGFGGKNLWLELDVKPSWLGRLRQAYCRPAVVRLAAWREESKRLLLRRRAPPSMLAAGFLASPLLLSTEDLMGCYTGNTPPRPAAYSVELQPEDRRFFQNTVGFRVYEIGQRKAP